jgi:hypothetical protein
MFFGIFSLGLTETAVAALCSQDCHSTVFLRDMLPVSGCAATASIVLAVVGLLTSLSLALLVRFHCRFSTHLWYVDELIEPVLHAEVVHATRVRASARVALPVKVKGRKHQLGRY